MRESLRKLQDACLLASPSDNKHWLSNLEQTQWLQHAKVQLPYVSSVIVLVLKSYSNNQPRVGCVLQLKKSTLFPVIIVEPTFLLVIALFCFVSQ